MSEEAATEGSITTPLGSLNLKGKKTAELISFICLALLFLMSYILWEHKTDAKDAQTQFVAAIKEMTIATRENVQAQREMNCLIALPQDRREGQTELCKRLSAR